MAKREQNFITDVRAAKIYVDGQFRTFDELGRHLRQIEEFYKYRLGEYATVPLERPEWVCKQIKAAVRLTST